MTRDELVEQTGEEELLFLDPPELDAAIIGVTAHQPGREQCVVYSYQQLMAEFVKLGMDDGEVEEHMGFNVLGAYVGPRTPIVVHFLPDYESESGG